MTQNLSLKDAERKIFRTTYNDGLWDIFLACFFFTFIIELYISPYWGDFWSSTLMLPVMAISYLIIWLIRKYVVIPRSGVVKFGIMRKTKLKKFSLIMLIVNILAFISGLVAVLSFGSFPGQIYSYFFGVTLLIFFSFAAFFLDINRLYIYGLIAGLSPLIGEWLWNLGIAAHHGWPLTFGTLAGIMTLIGFVIFYRFLRNNPLPMKKDES